MTLFLLEKELTCIALVKQITFKLMRLQNRLFLSADLVNLLCAEFFSGTINFLQTDQSSVSVKNFKKLVGQKGRELK